MLIKIQLDATVCRYLFTAQSLYTFRVSQHPSSGVLKTVTAGHNIGAATSLQRGLVGTVPIRLRWREVAVPILWPVPEAEFTVFNTPDDGCCDTRNMWSDFAVNICIPLHLVGFLLTLLVHILSQRIQSTPSAPHYTFQYYYPVCAYVIPIRITIVTTITITKKFLVSSHFKTICSELCFSSDRVHIPLRISLLSPLNFQNRNRNRAVPLLQQDTPTLFLSPFLLHFPGRNPHSHSTIKRQILLRCITSYLPYVVYHLAIMLGSG